MTMDALKDIIRPGSTRGLDFVVLDELRKRTGINSSSILKFALNEILCNALDKDATELRVDIQSEDGFNRLSVTDNGSKKLSLGEIKLILDFENKASSKRGFRIVSRGYLGNALKCIFGYSYALAESKNLAPPDVIIESGGSRYQITLEPDRINEVIRSNIVETKIRDDGLTSFTVKFPDSSESHNDYYRALLEDVIFPASMVNPKRRIVYDVFGVQGVSGSREGEKPIRNETSPLWYDERAFIDLFIDYVRGRPEMKLGEFIALFRGFTAKEVIREKLQKLGLYNHDYRSGILQFLPATPIKDLPIESARRLYEVMKGEAKPISKRSTPSVLGCVGKEVFEKVQKEKQWKRLKYVIMPGTRIECPEPLHDREKPCPNIDHVEFPYIVEIAVFDREEDGEGLKIYQCVNFMASMEDVFSKVYNISFHLGRVGITEKTPVTIVAHLVCPVLKWLNYGKTGLDE